MGVFTHSRAHKSAIQTELASHKTSWTKHEVNAILFSFAVRRGVPAAAVERNTH